MKNSKLILISILIGLFIVSCKKDETDNSPIKLNSISLSVEKDSLEVGESILIRLELLPEQASDHSVAWSSSDDSIATVTNGIVAGLKAGNVVISAKANDGSNVSDSILLTIINEQIKLNSISLSVEKDSLEVGESILIRLELLPEQASDHSVAWSSSDDSIASVTNGLVAGLKAGNVVISAKANDGSNVSDSILLTIINEQSDFRDSLIGTYICLETFTYFDPINDTIMNWSTDTISNNTMVTIEKYQDSSLNIIIGNYNFIGTYEKIGPFNEQETFTCLECNGPPDYAKFFGNDSIYIFRKFGVTNNRDYYGKK